MNKLYVNIPIFKYNNGAITSINDAIAIEEPLEISIAFIENNKWINKIISVTMRTPGNDAELAVGFLHTENIISSKNKIEKIEQKGKNKICVFLKDFELPKVKNIERNFYTTSSCGVCGKASIEAITTIPNENIYPQKINLNINIVFALRDKMEQNNTAFKNTGGIHSASMFSLNGKFVNSFEDVGRHNALDKLIGWFFIENKMPLQQNILLLSGRASFELIQKAAMAHIPIVCAIGAPSSLAVNLANEMDITLIGFLKNNSCNIYSSIEKLIV